MPGGYPLRALRACLQLGEAIIDVSGQDRCQLGDPFSQPGELAQRHVCFFCRDVVTFEHSDNASRNRAYHACHRAHTGKLGQCCHFSELQLESLEVEAHQLEGLRAAKHVVLP